MYQLFSYIICLVTFDVLIFNAIYTFVHEYMYACIKILNFLRVQNNLLLSNYLFELD